MLKYLVLDLSIYEVEVVETKRYFKYASPIVEGVTVRVLKEDSEDESFLFDRWEDARAELEKELMDEIEDIGDTLMSRIHRLQDVRALTEPE